MGYYHSIVCLVCTLLLVAVPTHGWTTKETNANFEVESYFLQEWNVTLATAAGSSQRTKNASWTFKDAGPGVLVGELVELRPTGPRRACKTKLLATSELEGQMAQQCGAAEPSVYSIEFTRLDDLVLVSMGPIMRGDEVIGSFTLTVASPSLFTLVVTSTDDPTVRTLICRRISEGRGWWSKLLLGVMCLALVVSQIYVKRRMRASLREVPRKAKQQQRVKRKRPTGAAGGSSSTAAQKKSE